MKIIITHDQSSIDPAATYSDEEFQSVIASLERNYLEELSKEYPGAEVEFVRQNCCGNGIDVFGTGLDDPFSIEDHVQSVCEDVYSTGNFYN